MRELVIMKEDEDAETEEEEEEEEGEEGIDFDPEDDDDEGEDIDEDVDENEDVDDRFSAGKLAALEVPEGGYDEEDDCLNVEDEEYLQAVHEMSKVERVRRQLYIDGEPVDDEDEDDNVDYTSPLDKVDMFQQFAQTLHAAGQREPELMQRVQQRMSKEDKKMLSDLMKIASERNQSSAT